MSTTRLLLALALLSLDSAAWAGAPFAGAEGNYSGITIPDHTNWAHIASTLKIDLLASGRFTGKVGDGLSAHRLVGRIDSATATLDVTVKIGIIIDGMFGTKHDLFFRVTGLLDAAGRKLTGKLEEFSENVVHSTASFTLSGELPDTVAGTAIAGQRQTSFIDPPPPSATGGLEIPGDGFSVIQIGQTQRRSARLAGKLPDGGAYSAGTALHGRQYGVVSPLYVPSVFVRPNGQVVPARLFVGATYGYGEVRTDALGAFGINAPLKWHKQYTFDYAYFPEALFADVLIDSRQYPRLARRALEPLGIDPQQPENATLTLQRGNLSAPLEAAITIKPETVYFERMLSATGSTEPNPYEIKVRVNAVLGLFSGSFTHPGSGKKAKFSGAFRVPGGGAPAEGRGAFRGSLSEEQIESGAQFESGSARITIN
jgi:hypothetical protein